MNVTWLHVSGFHFRGGDPYDRDVVLRALVQSVKRFREDGKAPIKPSAAQGGCTSAFFAKGGLRGIL